MSNKQTRAAKRYSELRKAGIPGVVTAHEAFRLTGGELGKRGDHETPVNLSTVATVSAGTFYEPDADGDHAERLGAVVRVLDYDEVSQTSRVEFADGFNALVRAKDLVTRKA